MGIMGSCWKLNKIIIGNKTGIILTGLKEEIQ